MERKTSTLMSLSISLGLIAVGIWILYAHYNGFGYSVGRWFRSDASALGGPDMGIVMVLFWVVILAALALAVTGAFSSHRGPASPLCDPYETLKQRYARGEIDKAQFDALRRDLRSADRKFRNRK